MVSAGERDALARRIARRAPTRARNLHPMPSQVDSIEPAGARAREATDPDRPLRS